MSNLRIAALLCTAALLASSAQAATLRVPSEYPAIQAGLDASSFGDTVLVAPGTYTDYETRNIGGGLPETACAFLVDGVLLKAEGGPAVTTIDLLEIEGPQPAGIIGLELPSDLTAVEGFTIEGRNRGLATFIALSGKVTLRECIHQNFDGGPTAGGAVLVEGDISILNCGFDNCKANVGGAVYQSAGCTVTVST